MTRKKNLQIVTHPNDAPRTCVFCKHFDFDPGSHGWSEYTPGDAAAMSCRKGHFDEGLGYDRVSALDFKVCLKKAATCPDYKPE